MIGMKLFILLNLKFYLKDECGVVMVALYVGEN